MARVLVVEDDPAIGDLAALYLRRDGHEIELVDRGPTALARFEATTDAIDLIVLDLMLPGLDGRGLCRRIRQTSAVPIIMLTALDDDRDKIEGLELGADDYLTKPFNPEELVARVRAILRRAARPIPTDTTEDDNVVTLGAARLDLAARRLTVGHQDVPLRPREFDLLVALAARPSHVHSRDRLLERVWGAPSTAPPQTVDVHVSRLREKLAPVGLGIETVRSVGYRLLVSPR